MTDRDTAHHLAARLIVRVLTQVQREGGIQSAFQTLELAMKDWTGSTVDEQEREDLLALSDKIACRQPH